MRQFNFAVIFIFCLALVFFSIENTEVTTVVILPGIQIKIAIAVALFIAAGLGATLAWFFSLWTRLQQQVILNQKSAQIQELNSKIEKYQLEIQSLKRSALPPASDLHLPQEQILA
ncbi:MAG: LapA family protein [Methylacidiphilales bacterium]|nr:LapA family protein [Candidatus Methylacidiphilales bacterium]NJR14537.1 LapA family protein [Calothrix sp. CSU_2_0]